MITSLSIIMGACAGIHVTWVRLVKDCLLRDFTDSAPGVSGWTQTNDRRVAAYCLSQLGDGYIISYLDFNQPFLRQEGHLVNRKSLQFTSENQ